MTQRVSILILAGIVLGIGLIFYRVIEPFLFSLLFAAVIGVLFRPVFTWVEKKFKGRRRLAAAATTIGILVMVVVPTLLISGLTGWQLFQVAMEVAEWANPENEQGLGERLDSLKESQAYAWASEQWQDLSEEQQEQMKGTAAKGAGFIANVAYNWVQTLLTNAVSFVLGFIIMMLALYYFYADGPELLKTARRFSPLSDEDELALMTRFEKVCRGVVLGTVVSAFVQAILAAIGFVIVGADQVVLLAAFTMFFAFIPFMGAAIVWVGVSIWLLFDQNYAGAIFLVIYGSTIVSLSDNVIKAYVIGGEAKLHPLIVLITVIGAIKLIGILGIFVGPMIAAFLYAFLDILRRRLLTGSFAADQLDRPVKSAEPS